MLRAGAVPGRSLPALLLAGAVGRALPKQPWGVCPVNLAENKPPCFLTLFTGVRG